MREASARTIAISTHVAALVGDTCATVLLSQLIYWSRRTVALAARQGWIFKTARDWEVETGLSSKMQRRARGILVDGGWIEERLQAMPARLEFRLRLEALLPALAQRSGLVIPPPSWSWVSEPDDPAMQRILGRSFLYHAAFSAHMPIAAAMLASRLLSAAASGRSVEARHGALTFVQLQRDAWRVETGLTRDQWQSARKVLRELDLLLERRRNFPRRVDLAIKAPAAIALLRSQRPADAAERDRAKQAGGFGCGPNPPPVAPYPAAKSFPTLPTRATQSHLYFSFQGQLHPQPRGHVGSGLAWPKLLADPNDRTACEAHLAGLSQDAQQAVLDEVDFIHATRGVARPVGLVRELSRKAMNGQFVAEGAHHIARARCRRAELEHRLSNGAKTVKQAVASPPEASAATVDVSAELDRLRHLSQKIRARGGR